MGNSKSNNHDFMGNSKSNNHDIMTPVMPQNVKEFHLAVMKNDIQTVKSLVEDGVNINFPWYNPSYSSIKDGSTPLIIAVSLNHIEIIEILLKSKPNGVNRCDRKGCTAIYKASFHGRPFLIELLSKAGADVDLSDFDGKTPMYICVNNCIVHTRMGMMSVEKLIGAGAAVDKRDKFGQGPIHLAAHWKLVDVMKKLIQARSDVNLLDKMGRTPLYICVSSLSTKLYKEDLRHQLPCVITIFNNGGDMLNLIEWLLHKGSGLTHELLKEFEDSEGLWLWYQRESLYPSTLKNLCRKAIQQSLSHKGPLVELLRTIPLPTSLRHWICRRQFYREPPLNHNATNGFTELH